MAGQQAVEAGQTVPRTTVVAIAEPIDALRSTTIESYGVSRGYEDYRQLLNDSEIDAVYLAVNPPMRYQMVLDSFEAGKHVQVQKPHAVRAGQILEFEHKAKLTGKNPTVLLLHASRSAQQTTECDGSGRSYR